MRKRNIALRRLVIWTMVLNACYDIVCAIVALTVYRNGSTDASGVFFTAFQMALPYVGHLALFAVAFGFIAVRLTVGIIIRDDEKDWPSDYERRYSKRELVYQMILVMLMVLVAAKSRGVYSIVSFVVIAVILVVEKLWFRIVYGKGQGVKISRRVKKERLLAALRKWLLEGENPRAQGKGGRSSFSSMAKDDVGYSVGPKSKQDADSEEKTEEGSSTDEDVLDDFMLKESTNSTDVGDDTDDFYASFLQCRDQFEQEEAGRYDENFFFK